MTLNAAILTCCIVGAYACIIIAMVMFVWDMIEDDRRIRRIKKGGE